MVEGKNKRENIKNGEVNRRSSQKWQLAHPEYLEEKYKERKKKLDLIKLSNGCAICGFKDFPEGLEYHHYDSTLKKFKINGENACRSWTSTVEEIKKCVILCATCHKGVTWGRLKSPEPNIEIKHDLEAIGKYDYERRKRCVL